MYCSSSRARPDRNGNGPEIGSREQVLNTANIPIDKLGSLPGLIAAVRLGQRGLRVRESPDGDVRVTVHIPAVIRALDLGHLSAETQRKVVCDNVSRLYNIDASKLPRIQKQAA